MKAPTAASCSKRATRGSKSDKENELCEREIEYSEQTAKYDRHRRRLSCLTHPIPTDSPSARGRVRPLAPSEAAVAARWSAPTTVEYEVVNV
jgi:hypothetical protein